MKRPPPLTMVNPALPRRHRGSAIDRSETPMIADQVMMVEIAAIPMIRVNVTLSIEIDEIGESRSKVATGVVWWWTSGGVIMIEEDTKEATGTVTETAIETDDLEETRGADVRSGI